MSVVQLKTFDPTQKDASGTQQGQIQTQISGKCGTVYFYNESLETLLLQDAADQLVGILPAMWAQPFVLKNPTSYLNWKVIASQNAENDYTLKEVQGVAYTTDEDTSKLYTGPLVRQASLGNTANTNTSLGVLDNTTSAPGTQIVNIVQNGGSHVICTLDNSGNFQIWQYVGGVYSLLFGTTANSGGNQSVDINDPSGNGSQYAVAHGTFEITGHTLCDNRLVIFGEWLEMANNLPISWDDSTGTRQGLIVLDATNTLNIQAGTVGGQIVFWSGPVGSAGTRELIVTKGAGGIQLGSASAGDAFDQTSNVTNIRSGSTSGFRFINKNGQTGVGFTATNGQRSGCGAGTTISHGLGSTPGFVLGCPDIAQAGSATVGAGSYSSTTFRMTVGAGSSVNWYAYEY